MGRSKKKTHAMNPESYVKVKKEKSDNERVLHPMSFYIDDRLELVKQVFGSLKPKTILNLAPDFLKVKTLEEIEEACLNELLCISSKRLKSIITASKCPTDTESSEEDSDVECREEHISLEEISSDSEIGAAKLKKDKKKKATNTSAESGVNVNAATKSNDNNPDSQISVLELLELQARARAIRSQLALEPITKIEVESDDEKKSSKAANKNTTNTSTSNKLKQRAPTHKPDDVSNAPIQKNESTNTRVVKKVKLKRNYRRPSTSVAETVLDSTDGKAAVNDNGSASASTKATSEKIDSDKDMEIKQEQRLTHSPSPDVIPIVLEPETLLLSDSSEGGETRNTRKTCASEIDRENEAENIKTSDEKDPKNGTQQQNTAISSQVKEIESEREEGEVIEDDEAIADDATNVVGPKTNEIDDSKDVESSCIKEDNSKIANVMVEDIPDAPIQSQIENTTTSCEAKNQKQDPEVKVCVSEKSNQSTLPDEDYDQNDDVISLEGGDIENEMIEHLQDVTSKPNSFKDVDAHEDVQKFHTDNVISLESSEEEPTINVESWQSRYMKSSKINKVLATSRLGKRVRDKIKQSKASNATSTAAAENNSERQIDRQESPFTSKHEDGSVEQYNELLEMSQRKT